MAKYSYGDPVDEDILVLQGVEYTLIPFGMRAFREYMARSKELSKVTDLDDSERTAKIYDLSVQLIVESIVPEEREAIAAHIDRSVPPSLVSEIASQIIKGLSDLDPTQQGSSSNGSTPSGSDSTDGVSPAE